jgi:hypothetical protein
MHDPGRAVEAAVASGAASPRREIPRFGTIRRVNYRGGNRS